MPAIVIQNLPRSAAYLNKLGVRFDDPLLCDWQCAVILADAAFSDDELEAANLDFGRGPLRDRNGADLLRSLDGMLAARVIRRSNPMDINRHDLEQLKGFFGSRGIKATKLSVEDDFWIVGGILWPTQFGERGKRNLSDMLRDLRSMTKNQRKTANAHLNSVPKRYLFTGAA